MAIENMNVQERMQAAIALEPVDRHPVFPILVTAAPRLYGVTQAEAWADHRFRDRRISSKTGRNSIRPTKSSLENQGCHT